MKRLVCRTSTHCLAVLSFIALCLSPAAAQGQARDARVISARAGGVNFVSGDVTFKADEKTGWQRLSATHNLDSGMRVRTGAGGLVEVLLNPGSYVRLGGGSELELTDASLDNLRLSLHTGRAVIEATGYDAGGLLIAVNTPQTQITIIRSGIYRVNVLGSGLTEVAVFKGRALVGRGGGTTVKDGRTARVGGDGTSEVAKLDKSNKDALDMWSKERAAVLAKVNDKLERRQVRTMLASYRLNDPFFTRGAGLWVYSASSSCYTFLPFYYGYASPYGRWYDTSLGWGGPCWGCGTRYGTRPVPGGVASPFPSSGGGGGAASAPPSRPFPSDNAAPVMRERPVMEHPRGQSMETARPVRRDQ